MSNLDNFLLWQAGVFDKEEEQEYEEN